MAADAPCTEASISGVRVTHALYMLEARLQPAYATAGFCFSELYSSPEPADCAGLSWLLGGCGRSQPDFFCAVSDHRAEENLRSSRTAEQPQRSEGCAHAEKAAPLEGGKQRPGYNSKQAEATSPAGERRDE